MHLCFDRRGEAVIPRYLTARDEVWIRALLEAFQSAAGLREDAASRVVADAASSIERAHQVWSRRIAGVRAVLERLWHIRTRARVPPRDARRCLFEEAARLGPFTLDEAVARAAQRLGCSPEEIVDSAYGDLPGGRELAAPKEAPSPSQVVEQYNLALVQGMLLRSHAVTVTIRAHARSVVRFAKLKRLLCICAVEGERTRVELSGPLALFRRTTKYGNALASFFPAVVATPGWALEADVLLGGEPGRVRIDCTDPIARTHALPSDADSDLERALARDLRRMGTPWQITREPHAYETGEGTAFPDFSLTRDHRSVLVEVVGYWTEEYLKRKLRQLEALRGPPVIVCVDESLGAPALAGFEGRVLRFRRRIDAHALVALAESLTAHAPTPASRMTVHDSRSRPLAR
jgi:hypothetical protein